MRRFILPAVLLALSALPALAAEDPTVIASEQGDVTVIPIEHATLVLESGDERIAVDPIGGADRSPAFEGVDLALVTDIHGDHFDANTLQSLAARGAALVAPAAVVDQLPADIKESATVLANGEKTMVGDVGIEAIPMYNLTPSRDFHPQGRGNGYVLTWSGLRIYISGDTEDTRELRNLEDIDAAFVCMNLPYTMDVEQAADGVLEMAPEIVYPYHYRGKDGLSDVGHFAELVRAGNPDIEVRQLDWYP